MDLLQQLNQAFKEFKSVQDVYSDWGASDSEPDRVFQSLCVRALKDPSYTGDVLARSFKGSAKDWQLYSKKGAKKAAVDLTEKASKVCQILAIYKPMRDLEPNVKIEKLLQDKIWRLGLDL